MEATTSETSQTSQNKMGLLVDKPKPGFGSTNNGNTARRFFDNPDISSKITGIDINLLKRFKVILSTISSGFFIDANLFHQYCLETARKYVEVYPWYKMPITVHKILLHSSDIISTAILTIGQLGEEAQESRNKDIKKYIESFSRKFSRTQNMEDIFHNLLISFDPYITSFRKNGIKKFKSYPPEVIHFFKDPELPVKVGEAQEKSDSETDSE